MFRLLERPRLAPADNRWDNAACGSNVFNLTTQGTEYTDVRTFIGGRFEASYTLANVMTLRPIVRLAYVHAFTRPTADAVFRISF